MSTAVLNSLVVLLLYQSDLVTMNNFHIVTSQDALCPGEFSGEPCLTLQQYASNPSISTDNITLLFESGNHTLNSMLSASGAMKYFLVGDGVDVTCESSAARLIFMSIEHVHIQGIRFTRCREITFTTITFISINSCTFQYCYGISWNQPSIYLSNINSTDIQNSQFLHNGDYGNNHPYGGALRIHSTVLSTFNCSFSNNSAYYSGGAIYATNSKLNISNNTFHSNTVRNTGGAVYAQNSNITINSTRFFSNIAIRHHGGAIHLYSYYTRYNASIIITASQFIMNKIYNNYNNKNGGAIYIYSYPEYYYHRYGVDTCLVLIGCTFSGNTAPSQGGAIYHYSKKEVTVRDCEFTRNNVTQHESQGGAIYSISHISVTNTNFTNNFAIDGGAIYVTNTSNIEDSVFYNNTARGYGGGLYSIGVHSSVMVTRSIFINNTALTLGGGAIYSNGRYANISISSSSFMYNSASYCSVLDVDEYYHYSVNLTRSVFTHNTATGQLLGGGVACIRNASIHIITSTFKHNSADLHGGVFYIDESATLVDGSLFLNNSASRDGGVFYTYVHAADYDIRRSQFSYNSAGDDGGVLFIGRVKSQVYIDECVFSWNDASDRGGVVAIIASSMRMEINRTNIFNNTASYGGIISACNSEVTVLEEELFVSTDPVYSFCTLYDGDVTHFNITTPLDLEEEAGTTTTTTTTTAINVVEYTTRTLIQSIEETSPSVSTNVVSTLQTLFLRSLSSSQVEVSATSTTYPAIKTTAVAPTNPSELISLMDNSLSLRTLTSVQSVKISTARLPVTTALTASIVSTRALTSSVNSDIIPSSTKGYAETQIYIDQSTRISSILKAVSSFHSPVNTFITESPEVLRTISQSHTISSTTKKQATVSPLPTSEILNNFISNNTELPGTTNGATTSKEKEYPTTDDKYIPQDKTNTLQINVNTSLISFLLVGMIIIMICIVKWTTTKVLRIYKSRSASKSANKSSRFHRNEI